MFPVTITLHDAAQLNAVMHALGAPAVEVPKPAAAPKAASGKATAKADAAPTKTADGPAPTAESAAAPAPASTAATTDPKPASAAAAPAPTTATAASPSYEPVGKAITTYAATHGRDAALAKLAELGVKSGKELKPEQYAAALELFGGTA